MDAMLGVDGIYEDPRLFEKECAGRFMECLQYELRDQEEVKATEQVGSPNLPIPALAMSPIHPKPVESYKNTYMKGMQSEFMQSELFGSLQIDFGPPGDIRASRTLVGGNVQPSGAASKPKRTPKYKYSNASTNRAAAMSDDEKTDLLSSARTLARSLKLADHSSAMRSGAVPLRRKQALSLYRSVPHRPVRMMEGSSAAMRSFEKAVGYIYWDPTEERVWPGVKKPARKGYGLLVCIN